MQAPDLVTSAAADTTAPAHVAIIMDGNGRWAAARGLPRAEGHRRGVEALRRTVKAAGELGVKVLTIYSFSAENWSRPAQEVDDLMALVKRFVRDDLDELHKSGVRIKVIGDRNGLDPEIAGLISEAETLTRENSKFTLCVAFNYGARQEIARAARKLAQDSVAGSIDASKIDAGMFEAQLDTVGLPDPDLVIRTSGEQRLSNFLLWQAAYAEFVFLPIYWPDFDRAALEEAIREFRRRERRFGGVKAQAGKLNLPAPHSDGPPVETSRNAELRKRVISSAVLGLAALVTAWLGGLAFLLFWTAAAFSVWWEWTGITGAAPRNFLLPIGAVAIAGMGVALHLDAPAIAAAIAVIGAGVVSATANEKRVWAAAGLIYAALVLIPIAILRHDPKLGLIAVIWLFAAVWTADIAAYFAGRFFGGPLLAPAVSPKKTWSGAAGGLAGGVLASTLAVFAAGIVPRAGLMIAAAVVVIASQIGDLFESAVKRHFNVKDASQLIPGHGGMMDRLDGFLAAAFCALLIGIARAGTGSPAAGLLQW